MVKKVIGLERLIKKLGIMYDIVIEYGEDYEILVWII